MTETTFMSPRLERPSEAPLAGVCLALARTTGTDVVLWRVLFVVLTVFGGLGVALYLACYVTIPAQGQEHSLVARLLHGPDRRVTTKQVLLLALVVVAAAGALHDNGGAVVVAGLAALGFLWWRRRHPSPVPGLLSSGPAAPPVAPATAAPAAEAAPTAGMEAAPAPTAVLPPYQPPVWTPPAPRPRSLITPLTLSVTALVVGVLLLVAAAGSVSIPTEVVLAVALGTVGIGLVASAFWGRARGLVPVALLLALALGGTFAARPAIDHGVGKREWTGEAGSTYRLGIGDATLQLPAGPSSFDDRVRDITAEVTIGHIKVLVPSGSHVILDARVTDGDIQWPGGESNGRRVHKGIELGPVSKPPLYVHVKVGLGVVEVRNG